MSLEQLKPQLRALPEPERRQFTRKNPLFDCDLKAADLQRGHKPG